MNKTLIIAEAGVNHNGNMATAKQLIKTARDCGADIIKFQTFHVNSLVSKYAPMADYQKKNTGKNISQKDMLEKLMLNHDEFLQLAEYCNMIGIEFLSTAFDIESIHFLDSLQNIWKIPSGEITNYPYLVEIGKTRKKVFLSTGMSDIQEIRDAVNVLKSYGTTDITILHCTTEYPAPLNEVNLNVIRSLQKEFVCPVGYSDHTEGIEVSLAAVALGAVVIEKHFTLDKNMPGPDHKASLEPDELRALVNKIRKMEIILGSEIKMPTETELRNRIIARKSIVAANKIAKGQIFTENNLTTKRPGNGISPMKWNELIGMKSPRDFEEDELIEL